MAKIVKYCSKCDEGFAEKFAFCPDCGAPLQAFEMNPVTNDIVSEPVRDETLPAPPAFITAPANQEPLETPMSFDNGFDRKAEEVSLDEVTIDAEYDDAKFTTPEAEIEPEGEVIAPTATAPSYHTPSYSAAYAPDDDYRITVIEETNGKQRNLLLLGASVFMIVFVLSATVYSLFTKTLSVGAIDDGTSLAFLSEQVPLVVDDEQEKKNKDDGGGGGGGGRDEKDPVNQGDLADQSKNPTRPPDPKTYRSDNFDLKTPIPQTEGNRTFEKKYGQWGDPNSRFGNLSSGPGTGGGTGTGTGTGQGSGTGTGTGSGNGSGSGSGDGNGNGGGKGDGDGDAPPATIRSTTPFKILARPKAMYTDEARTNNIQGIVRVKVTLLASGQVGSITPVSRLPYGLTEQAIAAARQIKFEPKRINGVPSATIVTFEYSFNIY